jgi:hypothetical protein
MTQELRKLADAATQGEWHQTPTSGIYQGRMIVTDDRAACIGETHNANATENAAYIAAANPAAIRAILDERDQLQAENERLKAENEALEASPFSEEAYEILQSQHRALQSRLNAMGKGEAVASIHISAMGREFDDWKCELPEGRNLLYAAPKALAPLPKEAYTAIAHRTASKYAHRSDPAHIVYTFFPHTLDDFVRKVEAAHGIHAAKGGQQCG